jgi:DNA-binding beta-propeller fold protein YncE
MTMLATSGSHPGFAAWPAAVAAMVAAALAGCGPPQGADAVANTFGGRGEGDGRFTHPRVLDVLGDELFVIDMTARVQVFTLDGRFKRFWHMPDRAAGKPTGMGIAPDGRLFVADTHYGRVIVFDREGRELARFGSPGEALGQFIFPSDVAFDSAGRVYVSEFGNNRVTQFAPDLTPIRSWGGTGEAPGEFQRAAALLVDGEDHVWVADAANHRLCLFDTSGQLLRIIGHHGTAPGELKYPYDLTLDPDGRHVVAVEFGNHRIQRFTLDGRSAGTWGVQGRTTGALLSPWACRSVLRGGEVRVFVADRDNDRVVEVRFPP